jgi:UDP-glucose 4-epimerase
MKTFVVTGCNGYIGSHMCHELGKLYPDCVIHGIDKHEKQHLRPLYDFYHNTDLAVDTINLPKGTDAIFHFAAYISVEEGELYPFRYYHNNVVGSLRLIDRALVEKVPNFIFSSTAAVYGEDKSATFGHLMEDRPMNPHSVYAKTKAMIEQVLIDTPQMNTARLRYFNAAGRDVRANLFEEHDPETHLIPLLARNKEATIFGDDWPTRDGTCIRDYVHVKDICRAHTLAYRHMEQTNESVVFNVGCGKGYTVKEVVDKANQILHNGEMVVRVTGRRDGDVPYLVADTARIKETIGFNPEYSLDDILESMKNG